VKRLFITILLLATGRFAHGAESWVHETGGAQDFPLVREGRAASLIVADNDHEVVRLAVADLARDIASVTGVPPAILPRAAQAPGPTVIIGTLGRSPLIDRLAAAGLIDVTALKNAWESFIITVVPPVRPEATPLLVIVGSDRRGTAFGVYELSKQIGVSPWHWWADVAPEKKTELLIPAGTHRFGPPSVKYRGIFINDEDWGLQPWAATNLEPENGGIGPKTYAKVFELLLRLKANTLWPAMHACTKPFNADPRNAALADDYAIVMGSSHAEPMLRNNVGEWTGPKPDYNYVANRDGVRAYWDERVRTNGRFENIYTVGMRGIHDSGIQGTKIDAERIAVLEQVFADQRAMLTQHVRPDLEHIPQMFCAYKEVLDLYRLGLKVPDDVTIGWPDDNFGYIRNFASAEERARSGGFGVYYHLSYLGRPLSYLWLGTTPPALIWEELTKAHAHGADRIWIANVGDLKPAEIGTEFFLRLAWDVNQWGPDAQPVFLREWAAREFGSAHADEIAAIMGGYYRLNLQRKPEHLQWWLPGKTPQPSDWSDADIRARLAGFADLRERAEKVAAGLPAAKRDAFFELVAYPVHGSALANARYFQGERGETAAAKAADTELRSLTQRFDEIAGGKWRGLMRLEPADDDWKSMRIAPWTPPGFAPRPPVTTPPTILRRAAGNCSEGSGPVQPVVGLGRTGAAVVLAPEVRLRYSFTADAAGDCVLHLHLLPTHPVTGTVLRLAWALDDAPTETATLAVNDGGPDWAQGVLSGVRTLTIPLHLSRLGSHTLQIHGLDAGTVLDEVVITGRGQP
jgi:hypothetical protein